jgi:hypothetical protein
MLKVTASGLGTQRFLHGLSPRQLDALAKTASEVMFPARHRIFADGDYAGKSSPCGCSGWQLAACRTLGPS